MSDDTRLTLEEALEAAHEIRAARTRLAKAEWDYLRAGWRLQGAQEACDKLEGYDGRWERP
jgi:hypothetical protein